ALHMARHREGTHDGLQLRVAGLRVERVTELPAQADERRRVALREGRGRERVGLVGRLAGARERVERALERVQPGDRAGRVEGAGPLAVRAELRDLTAEVVDEGQGGVPVLPGDVERREG